MELHNLKPAKGSVKTTSKRLGRGEATGNGGTAGRGYAERTAEPVHGQYSQRDHADPNPH